jgi:hypothetical protein
MSKSGRLVRRLDVTGRFPGQKEETTMQYMLLVYSDQKVGAAMPAAAMADAVAAYQAYTEALQAAGVLVGSNRLAYSDTASTVRVRDGKTQVLDGPYAETKEQLGGYYLVEAENLDAALTWAARCPGAAHGSVEVRPLWQMKG